MLELSGSLSVYGEGSSLCCIKGMNVSVFGNAFMAVDVILGVLFFTALFEYSIPIHEKILWGAALLWILCNMTMRGIENLNLHELNNKLLLSLFDAIEAQESESNRGKTKEVLNNCIDRVQTEARIGKNWLGHERVFLGLVAVWVGLGAVIAAII